MSLQYQVEIPLPRKKKVQSNYISTTKYNPITFFPLALLIQFKRYANVYFLVCAILQSIPLISPLNPLSAIAPLTLVLSLSMIREGFEDIKRYKSDRADNSQQITVIIGHQEVKKQWKDLKQGDIVKVKKDQTFPADIMVCMSSGDSGISYVETSSLDGEKNLKPKSSIQKIQAKYYEIGQLPDFNNFKTKIQCIEPTPQIEAFSGIANFEFEDEVIFKQKINKKNMALRGCRLRNTEWVVGIVIYTGVSTAIMMNSGKPYTKISNIETKVNNLILVILLFEIICVGGSAIYSYIGCSNNIAFEQFIMGQTNANCPRIAGIAFGSYFILYSTFIPISLIVSIEFVKVFQGLFMQNDHQMYCVHNNKHLECHSVSINEQLGQVQYILTDKTGTLTCNKMEFKNIVIGDQLYGDDLVFDKIDQNFDYSRLSQRYIDGDTEAKRQSFDIRGLQFELSKSKEQKLEVSQQQDQGEVLSPNKKDKKKLIELVLFMLSTCHQCVPSTKGGYEGPSPDEVALVTAASKVGFEYISTQNKIMKVEYKNQIHKFQLLKLIQFDSDRKRMTVVIKNSKGISVFVKGADTNIEKLLTPNQKYLEPIRKKTSEMTTTGLRSLWFAYKTYPIGTDIQSLQVEQIQNGLTLVGATGIQDRLQDYVPQTIYSLRQGGIKIIMLTGDKLETAQNIAISCRLIDDAELIRNVEDLKAFIAYLQKSFFYSSIGLTVKSPVIDGSSVGFTQCEQQLLSVLQKCRSAVFCRVTPGQKAQIVKLVKKLGKLTLAIGDGANDVNMIMQAHVGIGIFGQQGTRAAQVSNYAIGEFCLLWKLLLYYGRLNYMRVTELILYFFYKNMVFTTVQFVFSFYNLGSGQSFWLSWSITFYNMIFTAVPIVIKSIFEVDLEVTTTKKTFNQLSKGTHQNQTLYSYYPKMYYISQKNMLFTNKIFFAWFFLGFIQGAVCLILTLYSIGDQNDSSGMNSNDIGLYMVQISAYTSVIVVVTIKLIINVKKWNIILLMGILIPTFGFYVIFNFLQGYLQDQVDYNSTVELLSIPGFYILQVLCIGGMFSIDFLFFSIEYTKNNFSNYIKFRTLKNQKLSETNLKEYILELTPKDQIES